MTPDEMKNFLKEDPLSAACEFVHTVRMLLGTMNTLRAEEVENLRYDQVMNLIELADEQIDLIEESLEEMLLEIKEGRMPGKPGAPGQYRSEVSLGH